MERHSDQAKVRLVNAHLIERLGLHGVEAAASVHQYFHELLSADDRVDNKRVPSRVWDDIRMVGPGWRGRFLGIPPRRR